MVGGHSAGQQGDLAHGYRHLTGVALAARGQIRFPLTQPAQFIRQKARTSRPVF
jgi:hypothetical protein